MSNDYGTILLDQLVEDIGLGENAIPNIARMQLAAYFNEMYENEAFGNQQLAFALLFVPSARGALEEAGIDVNSLSETAGAIGDAKENAEIPEPGNDDNNDNDDNGDNEDPVIPSDPGQTFTLTEVTPSIEKTFLWDGVDTSALEELLSYAEAYATETNLIIENDDAQVFGAEYLDFIREYLDLVDEQVIFNPAVLTPTQNNEGVIEDGFTTDRDDTIVAGTSYSLHGAYIDGGGGWNTLTVDMKGPFAQPKQLFNIQEVQVQNLENYYGSSFFDWNNSDRTGYSVGWEELIGTLTNSSASILDLSRATDLQRLVITESMPSVECSDECSDFGDGSLTILGIQNYATAALLGGFQNEVTLHYTYNQGDVLSVELTNVTFADTFNIAHNVGAMNITSLGRSNILDNVNFGNYFQELTVDGDALLAIEGDLSFAWGEAFIDASENTGGLRVSVDSIGSDFEYVTIYGSQGRDVIEVSGTEAGVKLDIDMGDGRDTLTLNGVDAGYHSSIKGDNLTLIIDGGEDNDEVTNLSLVDVQAEGIVHIIVERGEDKEDQAGGNGFDPLLVLSQVQAAALLPLVIPAHGQNLVGVQINVTSSTSLSDLVDLSALNSGIKLDLNVAKGATLTLTAEELHKYVAFEGIDMTESQGKVIVTDAGAGFDPFAQSPYETGGTITPADPADVTIIGGGDMFERPGQAPHANEFIIDSTGTDGIVINANVLNYVENGEFNLLQAKKLTILGDADVTFTAPVNFDKDDFTVDFSQLDADLSGLTLMNFDEVARMIGNGGTPYIVVDPDTEEQTVLYRDVRVDVLLKGNVGAAGVTNGLKTEGVQTYVVTDLSENDSLDFYTCIHTKDVEFLGLQGNYDATINFKQVVWGVEFLMEGVYDKAYSAPNKTYVGTVVADFQHAGAEAVFHVGNMEGLEPGVELVVAGIEAKKAETLTMYFSDSGVLVEELVRNDVTDITVNSDYDVTITIEGTEADKWEDLESFTANVEGDMTIAVIGQVNLSNAVIDGVDYIEFVNENVDLTLNLQQMEDIELVVGFDPDLGDAQLHLVGLGEEEFNLGMLPEGVALASLTVAEEEVVTLNEDTDLTGVAKLIVLEGTTLNLTLAQYNQLTGAVKIDGDGTVNITDITQEGLTDEDGNWVDFAAGIDANYGTLTLHEDAQEIIFGFRQDGEEQDGADLGGFAIELAENEHIIFTNPNQAHEREITGDGETTIVSFHFNFGDLDDADLEVVFNEGQAAVEDAMDLSGYQGIVALNVWNNLVRGENVEQILGLLTDFSIVVINTPPDDEIAVTHRVVVVEPEVEVAGGLLFEDLRDKWAVETLELNLLGEVNITGAVDIQDLAADALAAFDTLTINSYGDEDHEANVMNDIQATNNNLLNVVVYAEHDLEINDITFDAVNDESEATFTVSGEANVTVEKLDPVANVDVFNVISTLDGTLAIGEIDMEAGDTLNIELGADTTLVLTENNDWSDLDLSITQTLPIVVEEGKTLTLTAEQADGLLITGEGNVVIVELGSEEYDFSGIAVEGFMTATLVTVDAEGDPITDVTLHEDTILGDFEIVLLGLGDEFGDGQTIRFQNPDQAARDISVAEVDDPLNPGTPLGSDGTNVVWLFNNPADIPAGGVNTNGYSADIGRLWVNDVLVDGQNVEQLFTSLPGSIIRVEYTGELPDALQNYFGFHRIVEIVAFIKLEDGLIFSDEDGRPFVENLTIDLGGEVELGDLLIDNVADPDLTGNKHFLTLTINSHQATGEGTRLMPEDWNAQDNAMPSAENQIGDIASGAGHQLLTVVLNTAGGDQANPASLEVASIAFDRDLDVDPLLNATLTVNGGETVTIGKIDLTDDSLTNVDDEEVIFNIGGTGNLGDADDPVTVIEVNASVADAEFTLNTTLAEHAYIKAVELGDNIATYTINNNGAGNLNILGGSPALSGDNLETLTINANNNGDVTIGSDEEDEDNYFGIEAPNLTAITANADAGRAITVVLDEINGEEFEFTAPLAGTVTVILDNVELDATGEWTFTGAQVTITGNADFSNGGSLTIGSDVTIEGEVDLTAVDLDFTGVTNIILTEGSQLRVTPEQLDALNPITVNKLGDETGLLVVVGEGDLTGLDLDNADSLVMTGDTTINKDQFEFFYDDQEEEANIDKDNNDLTLALVHNDDISELDTEIVDVILPDDGAEVTVTIAQHAKLAPEDDPVYTYDYNLFDTWANLSDPANIDVIEGAGAWTISDIADLEDDDLEGITAKQAAILVGATNAGDLTANFTVEDTWAGWQQLIADATADPADQNAEAALKALLEGDFEFDITDLDTADLDDLSVIEAAVLLGADSYNDEEYTISDDADQMFADETDAWATAIFEVNIEGFDAGIAWLDTNVLALLQGSDELKGYGLTVVQQAALEADGDIDLVEYSIADTWANLNAEDPEAALLADATGWEINNYNLFDAEANPFGTINPARVWTEADNFDPADEDCAFNWSSTANILFTGNNFVDHAEDILNLAVDVTVTDDLNAVRANRLSNVENSGDKTYTVVDTAIQIQNAFDFANADFSEATSITHNAVAAAGNTVSTATEDVEDIFVFTDTPAEEVAIIGFTAGEAGDVLDFTAFVTPVDTTVAVAAAADRAFNANDSIWIVDYTTVDINGKDYGDGDFAELFAGGGVAFNTDGATADADGVIIVRGQDETQIYYVENDGDNTIAAGEVTLVGVLDSLTDPLHADNLEGITIIG